MTYMTLMPGDFQVRSLNTVTVAESKEERRMHRNSEYSVPPLKNWRNFGISRSFLISNRITIHECVV
jgi:hypothetical protein